MSRNIREFNEYESGVKPPHSKFCFSPLLNLVFQQLTKL
jgi:hypothetical protein